MARQVSKAKQQLLRIGFVPIAEMKIFPYVLPNLRLQHPDLTIELSSLNNAEQLKALKEVNSTLRLPVIILKMMKSKANLS